MTGNRRERKKEREKGGEGEREILSDK
jgi:hypothetical protein